MEPGVSYLPSPIKLHDYAAGVMAAFGPAFAPHVRLPDERAGTLLIFRTYPNVSFGLIVGASNTIQVGDVVHNP